jgi:tetratricopeptide (TPR) repeat protein
MAQWKLGRHEESRRVLEHLLTREPDCVDAVRGLAANAMDQRDLPQALHWHMRLQELGDRPPEVLHNTAFLLHQTGDLENSIRVYRTAIEARPEFAEALLNLGHVLQAAGKDDEARDAWVRALEIKPELARGYFLSK